MCNIEDMELCVSLGTIQDGCATATGRPQCSIELVVHSASVTQGDLDIQQQSMLVVRKAVFLLKKIPENNASLNEGVNLDNVEIMVIFTCLFTPSCV